ncbi:MAG: carbohydrate ABC transporter permease [Candidatus Devosia phytovorans]|uniref:Maltose/maltodextrin transport system permease protein MalG n=1 Tax=Candidatus Devosia phytovorans TaxID=3121372 RepID=A0AAJ6AZU5_9HYPH|nr:carbohydrate ABC transporter permease [Devosia sp.]WEK04507.1 MAG: carbohydrate ABC transporter permease [Devosia sp.]
MALANNTGLRRFALDLFVAVFGIMLCLILAFPFIWVVLISFRPDNEIFTRTFQLITSFTLDNYAKLLDGSPFPTYLRNSIIVCSVATVVAVSISLITAYGFSRWRTFRGRQLLLILVITTQLFPFVILITPLYATFFQLGLINNPLALVISYIAVNLPFCIYMLLGYLDTIPRELDEAARIDGANTLQIIFRVILPVAWPGVVTVAVYAFVSAWDEFLFALTLMTSDENKTVPVGLAGFFGEYTTQWNLVMTASVVSTVPTLVLFMFLQKKLVSDLAAGAIKQ